jgi:hypothetical protein
MTHEENLTVARKKLSKAIMVFRGIKLTDNMVGNRIESFSLTVC